MQIVRRSHFGSSHLCSSHLARFQTRRSQISNSAQYMAKRARSSGPAELNDDDSDNAPENFFIEQGLVIEGLVIGSGWSG